MPLVGGRGGERGIFFHAAKGALFFFWHKTEQAEMKNYECYVFGKVSKKISFQNLLVKPFRNASPKHPFSRKKILKERTWLFWIFAQDKSYFSHYSPNRKYKKWHCPGRVRQKHPFLDHRHYTFKKAPGCPQVVKKKIKYKKYDQKKCL